MESRPKDLVRLLAHYRPQGDQALSLLQVE